MNPKRFAALAALLVVATLGIGAQPAGTIQYLELHSQALEGNLLGDPADQEVAVYLPPGYDKSTARYPVLYLLHGIGGGFTDWTKHWDLRGSMDAVIAAGSPPFLVVMPNGGNRLGGGFYMDSPVSGKWETYIVGELLPHIDRAFRTRTAADSRGIAGHSMGGFGALRLAMRHPDLFTSVYAMSPCCLDLVEDIGHGNQAWRKAIGFKSPDDIAKSLAENDFYPVAIYALASALSPNPDKPPFYVDLPVRQVRGELMPEPVTDELWRNSLLMSQLPDHRAALLRMRAIALDYGTSEQFAHISATTPEFSHELARLRVPHRLEVYDGDHREKIPARLKTHVLPFFGAAFPR
ncbi:MAG TPA: alpha/beta fold hydrolase [Thermoanaerobaculia bacterium]